MRILGIDYGEARVGVAITDPLNITAQGLETIQRNGIVHSEKSKETLTLEELKWCIDYICKLG